MRLQTITKAVAITLSLLALAACHKDRKPRPDPGHVVDPSEQEEQQKVTPGLKVVADYWGDAYECGYDDYVLYFQIGERDADGSFKKDGVEVSLDILVKGGSATTFPAGKYTITDGKYNAAGILPSVPVTLKEYLQANGESIAGYSAAELAKVVSYGDTSFYVQTDEKNWWLAAVDEATLEVGVKGGTYTFLLKMVAAGDSYTYYYEGALEINDNSAPNPPAGGEQFTMQGINEVYAYNQGHIWGSDTDDWFVYMYNSKTDEEYIVIELVANTGTSRTLLPSGTYTVPSDFYDIPVIPAGTLCPVYEDQDQFYGSYYGRGEYIWCEASEGYVRISKSGDNYTFDVNFYDALQDASFTAKYTGPVSVNANDYVTSATKGAQVERKNHSRVQKVSRRPVSKAAVKKTPVSGVRRMTL